MRRVTRRVTSKSRLWINELKVSWLLKRVYYFQCIFLKYLDQRLDSFDSFPEDTVTTRHLSTLWISVNKNWTFACLALAKINYKTRILKKPSTLDTSTKSQTHVRNSKKEETCQGHVLHFNGLKGLAVEKAKNRPLPRKPPCYAGYEHQQHSIWKTTNCHVTSHAVTPVSRKQCHTLVPHLIHLPHIASTRDLLFGLLVFTSMRKDKMQLYSIIFVLGEYFALVTFILSLKISGSKLFW